MRINGSELLRQVRRSDASQKIRHHLEYTALRGLAWLIPKLPRRVILMGARGLGSFAMRVDRRGRQLGLRNLRSAIQHGELDLGGRSPEQVLRACYENFARGWLDLFWFTRLTAASMAHWVEIENEDEIRSCLSSDCGAIFITPHYGMFEWSSLIIGFRGVKLNIVAQDFANPSLTTVFRRAREHSGHCVISREGAMLKLLRAVRRGEHVAMLPDLNIRPQGAATTVQMFGAPACLTSIHVEIAKRCGAPMFLAICEPLPDGRAKLRVLDVVRVGRDADQEEIARATQSVWDLFEKNIRIRPELWMWMYKHWRFQLDSSAGACAPADSRDERDAAVGEEAFVTSLPLVESAASDMTCRLERSA
jgi:KDO2-lipid IV(A) lauroyltransferase